MVEKGSEALSEGIHVLSVEECKDLIMSELDRSGSRMLLRQILTTCGWTAQIKQEYLEYIKSKGPRNVKVDKMIKNFTRRSDPHVATLVPESARKDIEARLRKVADRVMIVLNSGTTLKQYENALVCSSKNLITTSSNASQDSDTDESDYENSPENYFLDFFMSINLRERINSNDSDMEVDRTVSDDEWELPDI